MDTKKENTQLAESLKLHVYKLAHEIGDRNIFQYERLSDAAEYIAQAFVSFGYDLEFQEYEVSEKKVKNIIVTKCYIITLSLKQHFS